MKKIITILILLSVMKIVSGQSHFALDSTYEYNPKLIEVRNGINRIENTLIKIFDEEKISEDTMTYLVPSRKVVREMKALLVDYSRAFLQIDSVFYDQIKVDMYQINTGQNLTFDYFLVGDSASVGLIHEWDSAVLRLESIASDTTIVDRGNSSSYNLLVRRKSKLEASYKKIKPLN